MKKIFFLCMICFLTLSAQTQNVGIGTTNPGSKFHVVSGSSGYTGSYFPGITLEGNGNTYINLLSPNANETAVLFGKASDAASGGIVYNNTGTLNGFQFRNNGNLTRMVINNAGNVGIGITTPNATLEVVRGTGGGGTAVFKGTAYSSHFNFGTDEDTYIRAGKDNRNVIINDIPGGRVGIGTATPLQKLHVEGTTYLNGIVGIGTAIPNASALLDVSSTTQGFLPPRMSRNAIINISAPAEGLIVYNLNTKKPNYYNGTEWLNFDGNTIFTIGDNYQGGIIAYILRYGDPGYIPGQTHGLIAAVFDQSTGAQWGCEGTYIPGADSTALGYGNQNTIYIMAGCGFGGIAARICGDLVLNGYNDWYLPSKDELNILNINRVAIGGFANTSYWSSSESSTTNLQAWTQSFPDGSQSLGNKSSTSYNVRAIRSF